jgi:hypothetical protein
MLAVIDIFIKQLKDFPCVGVTRQHPRGLCNDLRTRSVFGRNDGVGRYILHADVLHEKSFYYSLHGADIIK